MTKKNEKNTVALPEVNIIAFGRGKVILARKEDVEYIDDGMVRWLSVDKAWTIRTWGTSHGLGELTEKGPTGSTVLDAIPHGIWIPTEAIHGMWIVSEKAAKAFVPACEASDQNLLKG